jgi:protein-tyrosine phosphatase
VTQPPHFIDIHCHLLPGLDDGARSWDEAVEMARMAEAEGTSIILATPHQLGPFRHIQGEVIRRRTAQLQELLAGRGIPIQVLSGAEVRPDEDLLQQLLRGNVLTLAEQRRHLLLEMPRRGYQQLIELLSPLRRGGVASVLAGPERHPELQTHPERIRSLVKQGCLMQVAAGSLLGEFGSAARKTCEWMLRAHLVHFLATDARGSRTRRPLMRRAFEKTCECIGEEMAQRICIQNPASVVAGKQVENLPPPQRAATGLRWIPWLRAA